MKKGVLQFFLILVSLTLFSSIACGNKSGKGQETSGSKAGSPQLPGQEFPSELLEEQRESLAPILKKSVWSVKDSVVHADNKPLFPLGIYYVAHYPEQKGQRLKDLELIAKAGFSFIHSPIDHTDQVFLDKCANLGVYAVVEFNYTPDRIISLFKDHPAVAAWSTFDDVDSYNKLGFSKYSPAHVRSTNQQTKGKSPSILTYISGGYPKRIDPYSGTSDLLGFQVYPIPAEEIHATTLGYLNPALESVKDVNQVLIGNLQSFAWPEQRFPTIAEFRNMTYQAVIAGVGGIIYYAFFDSVTDLNNQPDFWKGIEQVVRELKALEPFLLYGKKTKIKTGKKRSFSAKWQYSGRELTILADSDLQTVQVTLN